MNKVMKRGLFLLVLSALLIAVPFQGFCAVKFTDVPSDAWYLQALEKVSQDSRQILQGYSDGTFKPGKTLDVCEFIKCIMTVRGFSMPNGKGYWAENYIQKAGDLGYIIEDEFLSVSSDPFEEFKRPITRGEVARLVARVLLEMEGQRTINREEIISLIADYDAIDKDYKLWVCYAYDMGVMGGFSDNTFKADKSLSRAEAVAICLRLIDSSARLSHKASSNEPEEQYTELGSRIYVANAKPGDQPLSYIDGISSAHEKIQAFVNSLGDVKKGEVTYHLFKTNFVDGYYYLDLIIRNGTQVYTDELYANMYLYYGDELQVIYPFSTDWVDLGGIAPGMSRYIRVCVEDRDCVLVDEPATSDVTMILK